jgi:hypothetical protein
MTAMEPAICQLERRRSSGAAGVELLGNSDAVTSAGDGAFLPFFSQSRSLDGSRGPGASGIHRDGRTTGSPMTALSLLRIDELTK